MMTKRSWLSGSAQISKVNRILKRNVAIGTLRTILALLFV